ncbi:MAG: ribonuclease III [Methylobacterium mesophilicum]|nr:ribonuclease III [Methylobacterium mesophilicum]
MSGRGKRPTGAVLAERLFGITGYRVRDVGLVERALTHSSVRGRGEGDYERLEFLGDRVLGLLVADCLLRRFPAATEGELALRLNALVSREACAEIAEESGLTELIRADIGLKALQGRKARNVRADVVEAMIAAIYLDGGLEGVRPFIEKYWTKRMNAREEAPREAKTALQEWAVTRDGATPTYSIDERTGPDHDPLFTVSVSVPGLVPTSGQGGSRRKAEQAAAEALLVREGVWPAKVKETA